MIVVALAVAFATAFALYAPGLQGPLLLDDTHIIVPLIEAAADGAALDADVSGGGPLGRPLSIWSFAANATLNGGALGAWKATNVALHAMTGLVLFGLLRALMMATGSGAAAATRAAAIGALLWLVHPLHVSTVLYTVQRMTQLAALGTLAGMLCYVHGRLASLAAPAGWRGFPAVLAAFVLFTPLATLAKESGALLPLLLGAMELTVFGGTQRPRWLPWTYAAGLALPYAAGAAWLLAGFDAHVLAGYRLRDFTPAERLLSEAWIVLLYLRWIVLPRRDDLGFHHDDIEPSRGLGDPVAAAAVLTLAAVAVLGWRLRRRYPLGVLGVAWYFVAHLLESSVFPLELAFEHRNYLPSAGVVLALLAVALGTGRPRACATAAVAAVLVLAFATAGRAVVWGDEGRLYAAFLETRPQSVRARLTAAEWLTVRGRYAAALDVLDGFDHPTLAVHRLRVLCARDGDAGAGDAAALAAAAREPIASHVRADALILLGRWAVDGVCRLDERALADALAATGAQPLPSGRRFSARLYGAMLRERAGDLDGALELLARAADNQPADPLPWYLGAEWAALAGRRDAARALLERARDAASRGETDYAGMDAAVAELVTGGAGGAR